MYWVDVAAVFDAAGRACSTFCAEHLDRDCSQKLRAISVERLRSTVMYTLDSDGLVLKERISSLHHRMEENHTSAHASANAEQTTPLTDTQTTHKQRARSCEKKYSHAPPQQYYCVISFSSSPFLLWTSGRCL